MRRLCTICARGGSKGVKNKNIRELLQKPLIAHSISQAKKANIFELIAVSSDSKNILDIAAQWGADVIISRPCKLAADSSAKLPVIQHCVREVEFRTNISFDCVVDLDVTSPLRSVNDIVEAVQLMEERDVSNVITGSPARRSPYFNLVELNEDGYVRLSKPLGESVERRQDSPVCFDMNASIYVWKKELLLHSASIFFHDTLLYLMPEERSFDIDTELDFDIVEFLAKKRGSLV